MRGKRTAEHEGASEISKVAIEMDESPSGPNGKRMQSGRPFDGRPGNSKDDRSKNGHRPNPLRPFDEDEHPDQLRLL